jgi:hypothetical protein
MEITRVSPVTGITNTIFIDVSIDQVLQWQHGALIQDVMPELSPDEREFIMSGISPTEWDDLFADEGFPA